MLSVGCSLVWATGMGMEKGWGVGQRLSLEVPPPRGKTGGAISLFYHPATECTWTAEQLTKLSCLHSEIATNPSPYTSYDSQPANIPVVLNTFFTLQQS